MSDTLKAYRPCVGICLFDRKGRLWLGKRMGARGPQSWQCPQGGLDKGESAEFGALRELWEETGVQIHHLRPLGTIEDWLHYDFPPGAAKRLGGKYRGQKQRWFAYRYLGKDKHFDLQSHGPQEFSEFEWVDLKTAPERVVPFKRDVYERLVAEFAPFAKPGR